MRKPLSSRSKILEEISCETWKDYVPEKARTLNAPSRVLISREYLVQERDQKDGIILLSICSVKYNGTSWQDKIEWDTLQDLKRQAGYGDRLALEVYPRDVDLVNVANFRHLWVMPKNYKFGWSQDE